MTLTHRGIVIKKRIWLKSSRLAELGESESFDAIIQLAGILSKDDDPRAHSLILNANVNATQNLLEISRRYSAAFIFPSTGLVYGNHKGPFDESMPADPEGFYALSKLISENCISMVWQSIQFSYCNSQSGNYLRARADRKYVYTISDKEPGK